MKKTIGIDIGGTKIAAGIVYENGEMEHVTVLKSQVDSREGMFVSLCQAIDEVIEKSQIDLSELTFGIGVPGLVNSEEGIAIFQNNLPWADFPLKERLLQKYPTCTKISMNNDVYQAALAEWYSEDLNDQETLVFFTISTGVSTAIVRGGEFIKGAGFAGEVGLLPVLKDDKGEWVRLEQLTSGNALADSARTLYNDGMIDGEELFARFNRKDSTAIKIIDEWAERIALGLYTVISMLDPEKIVLGGSVIQKNPNMLPLIKEKLAPMLIEVQQPSLDRISVTGLNNQAGLLGAGYSGIYQAH